MNDFFGNAVAVSGNTAVVGALGDNIGGVSNQASVSVFVRSGNGWALQQQLIASDGVPDDFFGASVALNGDTLVVGAYGDDHGVNSGQGKAAVSAASYEKGLVASDSIVAAFGAELSNATAASATTPLPTTLAGVSVSVRDSLGAERFAPLFFVSPAQINLHLPPGTTNGNALISVWREGEVVASNNETIAAVSPGLFAVNANGQGVASALVLRVKADGSQGYETLTHYDAALSRFMPTPINLGPASDRVFLVLFGTGFRYRSALGAVGVIIGGVNTQTLYAGAQGALVGLDQLNVEIPRALIGRGEIEVVVTVDGKPANTLKAAIQ